MAVVRFNLYNALMKTYEGEIASALANIEIYMQNPTGIGEHPDLVTAVDTQFQRLAEASEKLAVLKEYFKQYTNLKYDDI